MRKKILILGLVVVLVGVVCVIGYRVFFLKMVRVPSGSMANTIIPGDHLVIRKLLGKPARGDIVVFDYPNDPTVKYIARVIGLPTESVEVRHRLVYINGKELQEQRALVKPPEDLDFGVLEEISIEGSGPYRVFYYSGEPGSESRLPRDAPDLIFGTKEPYRIADNQYFVMGDNRDNSLDSRTWGTVPRESIWGKATIIYWSSVTDKSHEDKIRWERINKKVK